MTDIPRKDGKVDFRAVYATQTGYIGLVSEIADSVDPKQLWPVDAFMKALYNAAIEDAAKVVQPTNEQPCDCIGEADNGSFLPNCYCMNSGDTEEAMAWCCDTGNARRIKELKQ